MAITTGISGTVAKILLSGGIDYARQEEFKGAIRQALSAGGVNEIQVDFTGTTFLDSSAIRALLTLKKETEASGRSLLLLNCNETLRDIFEIGGFDRVFTFR